MNIFPALIATFILSQTQIAQADLLQRCTGTPLGNGLQHEPQATFEFHSLETEPGTPGRTVVRALEPWGGAQPRMTEFELVFGWYDENTPTRLFNQVGITESRRSVLTIVWNRGPNSRFETVSGIIKLGDNSNGNGLGKYISYTFNCASGEPSPAPL